MKNYLEKTLKDTFLIWLTLEIGIVISAILYAILKVGGVPGNTSLLVAFIVLVGLIVFGLAFFSIDTSGLRQLLRRWLLGEQKQAEQLESLVVRQNVLLEKLNQNLSSLAVSSAVESVPDLASKQSSREFTFRLSSDSLAKLDVLVDVIDSHIRDSMIGQSNIVAQLTQNQQREQAIIKDLGSTIANQQASLADVVENLTAQRKTLEQLTQVLEQLSANKEEISVKAAVMSPEGRGASNVETSQVYSGTHVKPAPHMREQHSGYTLTPETKPSSETEQQKGI